MTSKIILTCTTALVVAAAASSSADARGFGGGMGASHFATARQPMMAHQPGWNRPTGDHRQIANHDHDRRHDRDHDHDRDHHHDHDHDHDHARDHHHHHWVFRDGSWIYVDEPDDLIPATDPAPATVSGPCTCLIKTYTVSGLVVFADVCTQESASAPATEDLGDASKAPTSPVPARATPISQVPTAPNYAGRTYQDFLADNPQLARPHASAEQNQPEK